MPSNKRQRELARRRAERQNARRAAEKAKRRRRNTVLGLSIGGAALLVVLILVLVTTLSGDDKKPNASASQTPTPTATTPVACGGKTPPAPKKQSYKSEPKMTIDPSKTYTAHLVTSCGVIEFSMDAKKAPHTTNAMTFLANNHYFDGTFCHRMTKSAGLVVLQCGDPDGTGAGGPGFTLPEENLTGAKYKRGVVAMAKTNAPHSTGSQFFLVDQDSELPPQYTVLGQMTPASLTVLDKIEALGIDNGQDGAPKQKVYIESFTVTAK